MAEREKFAVLTRGPRERQCDRSESQRMSPTSAARTQSSTCHCRHNLSPIWQQSGTNLAASGCAIRHSVIERRTPAPAPVTFGRLPSGRPQPLTPPRRRSFALIVSDRALVTWPPGGGGGSIDRQKLTLPGERGASQPGQTSD